MLTPDADIGQVLDDVPAADRCGLGLVGRQDVDEFQYLAVADVFVSGSRVEDRREPGRLRPLQAGDHCFETRDKDRGFREKAVVDFFDIGRSECCIRSRCDADLILAGLVDHDQSDASRFAVAHPDLARVDVLATELLQRFAAEGIVADSSDEAHSIAGCSRRRDGLVRPLAASCLIEVAAGHGLAGRRQFRRPHDQVGVHGSQNDDLRTGHRAFRNSSRG